MGAVDFCNPQPSPYLFGISDLFRCHDNFPCKIIHCIILVVELVRSLQDENSRYAEQHSCRVCLSKEISTVLTPCGHVCCCDDCAPQMYTCPVCRAPVQAITRIYFPWERTLETERLMEWCTWRLSVYSGWKLVMVTTHMGCWSKLSMAIGSDHCPSRPAFWKVATAKKQVVINTLRHQMVLAQKSTHGSCDLRMYGIQSSFIIEAIMIEEQSMEGLLIRRSAPSF